MLTPEQIERLIASNEALGVEIRGLTQEVRRSQEQTRVMGEHVMSIATSADRISRHAQKTEAQANEAALQATLARDEVATMSKRVGDKLDDNTAKVQLMAARDKSGKHSVLDGARGVIRELNGSSKPTKAVVGLIALAALVASLAHLLR